jgi:hypothetical protein
MRQRAIDHARALRRHRDHARHGHTFLPQYEKESDTRYDARLASTFALNKLRDAVDAASAKPFKTLMKFENNTDPDLDLWVQDIDLQGNHLHIFAHQFFNDALLAGQSHILVDHPSTVNLPNLGAQKAAGVRPFMKAHQGRQPSRRLHRVRGRRSPGRACAHQEPAHRARRRLQGDHLNQIFVIEKEPGSNGVVQLWEQGRRPAARGHRTWTSLMGRRPVSGTSSARRPWIAEVPLVTLYAGEKEADFVTRPVFLDLAYKQIEHWISSSDQRSILAAARFPMLACSGVELDPEDEADFAIGPYKILYSPDAKGRWYYVEPKGNAIESGRLDLEALELQMDMMALNPVTGTHRQYVPQNERDIQETRVHSVIHDIAISCCRTPSRRRSGSWACGPTRTTRRSRPSSTPSSRTRRTSSSRSPSSSSSGRAAACRARPCSRSCATATCSARTST